MTRASFLSMLSILCLSCSLGPAGPPGAPGPDGDPGDTPHDDPMVLDVFPASGVLDRRHDVTLLLRALDASEVSAIDFGPGVVVEALSPGAGSDLRATVRVMPDAELGARDVVVTATERSLELENGFEVVPAIDIASDGFSHQGGLVWADVTNRDQIAFDPFTFRVTGPGIDTVFEVERATDRALLLMLVAPAAPTGPAQLVGANSFGGAVATTFLSDPQVVDVAPRSPTPVALGLEGQALEASGATASYRHDLPAVTGFVDVTLAPSAGSKSEPIAWVFGDSGDFDSYLGLTSGLAPIPLMMSAPSSLHVVVGDSSLAGGPAVQHDISFASVAAVGVGEAAEPHDALPGQLLDACVVSAAGTPCVIQGAIGAGLEFDVYRVATLDPVAGLAISLVASEPMAVWAQRGDAPALEPSWYSELYDFASGLPWLATGRARFVHGATFGTRSTWTIVVASAGGTGGYLLGLRPHIPNPG
jgi:hypothetical protein